MENFELTPEILSKASECETAEEIQNKAKEFGKDITPEQAQRVFDISHAQNGAVSDEELDNVAGGLGRSRRVFYCCEYCSTDSFQDKSDLHAHIAKCHPEHVEDLENYKNYHKLC